MPAVRDDSPAGKVAPSTPAPEGLADREVTVDTLEAVRRRELLEGSL